jgi:hypothetical protein
MALNSKAQLFVDLDWKKVYKKKDTDFDGIRELIAEAADKLRKKPRKRRRQETEVLITYAS